VHKTCARASARPEQALANRMQMRRLPDAVQRSSHIPNSIPQYKKRLDLLKYATHSLVFDITALILGV